MTVDLEALERLYAAAKTYTWPIPHPMGKTVAVLVDKRDYDALYNALLSELRALREDAERLDFIEQLDYNDDVNMQLIQNWRVNGKRYATGLRAAIDAARRKP